MSAPRCQAVFDPEAQTRRERSRGAEQPKAKKVKAKNDPKLVAAARELRDRWLEKVNAPVGAPILESNGKYEVSRALPETRMAPAIEVVPARVLPQAIAA